MATPVRLTGFEMGVLSTSGGGIVDTLTGTVNTNIAIDSTNPRSGTYSLRVYPTSAAAHIGFTVSSYVTVSRFYVRLASSLPTSDHVIIRVMTAAQQLLFSYQYNSGSPRFAMTVNSSTPQYHTGVVADTWYRVDFRFDTSTGTSTIDWQIDGSAKTQATRTVATANQTVFNIGVTTAATADFRIDDFILSYTSGDYPLGQGSCVAIWPTADGTHNNASNVMEDSSGNDIDGSTYTAYDKLDEIPLGSNANTDRVQQTANGTGNYCEVQLGDLTANAKSSINGIRGVIAYQSAAATSNTAGSVFRRYDAGTPTDVVLYGIAGALTDYSETSTFYKGAVCAAPSGGWTETEVNNLRLRFGYSDDAAPDIYWLGMMVEVDGPDQIALTINNAAHSLACDGSLALAQQHTIAMNDAAFALASSSAFALTENRTLAMSDAAFTLAATTPTLEVGAGGVTLTMSDAAFAVASDNIALFQAHTLAVQNAALESASTTPTLVQQHTIAVSDAALSSTSDNIGLVQQHTIAVNAAAFVLTSDNVSLETPGTLSVNNAAFTHAADNVALFQAHTLAVNNSAFTLAAENITLGAGLTLSVDAAAFTSKSDNVALTQVHILGMSNASIESSASNVTLGVGLTLAVQNAAFVLASSSVALNELRTLAMNNASFALAATSPTLERTFVLAMADASCASTAGSVTLFQAHTIVVASASVALAARSIVLATPELAVLYPDDAAFVVTAQRIMMLEATEEVLHSIDVDPREYVQNSDPRTFVHLSNARAYVAEVEPRMRP